MALESEAAVGVRIDVLFEGNNWSSLRKSLTFRIYTYNLQPNWGLKSSFALTSVKVFCLFTCRATVVLLLQENNSTLSQVRSLELWLKHAIQFKWNGIRNSWLPWIMLLHFTSLLPHKNTISICTVRLNDTILWNLLLPTRSYCIICVSLFHIFILLIYFTGPFR